MSGEKKIAVFEGLLSNGVWVELSRSETEPTEGVTWRTMCKEATEFFMQEGLDKGTLTSDTQCVKFRTEALIAFRTRVEDIPLNE